MIEMKGVYKSYGAIKVLESMNLRAEEGKPLCLLGKSGCGKSTALKIVALITKPDRGSLLMSGREVSNMTNAEMDGFREENMAYAFQEPLLIPYITALENVTAVTGASKERAVEVLTRVGLKDRLDHKPPKLSGGEKKRVDVVRAVLRSSPILVADEPLSNIDPEFGGRVMELLTEQAESGGILVYSSVDPSQAKYAAKVVDIEKK